MDEVIARRNTADLGFCVWRAAGAYDEAVSPRWPLPALVFATLAWPCVATSERASAQREIAPGASVEVRLDPPSAPVRLGEPVEIVARVTLANGARGPWMLAPTSDGPAVEVVRGRLLSIDADALEPAAGRTEARLRIPVLARALGTTVLRARVEAYGCDQGRCRAIVGEGSLVLEVEPP